MSQSSAKMSPLTLASLCSDNHSWLKNWLTHKLQSAFDADDVVQDTFVRIMESDSLTTIRDLKSFLCTIAKRVIIDLYRRHALERAWLEMLSELPEALAPSPELRQSQLELLQQIDAILDRAYACLRKNKKIFIRCCPFSLTRSTYSLKPKTITEKL